MDALEGFETLQKELADYHGREKMLMESIEVLSRQNEELASELNKSLNREIALRTQQMHRLEEEQSQASGTGSSTSLGMGSIAENKVRVSVAKANPNPNTNPNTNPISNKVSVSGGRKKTITKKAQAGGGGGNRKVKLKGGLTLPEVY